jgi:hypothetical protein
MKSMPFNRIFGESAVFITAAITGVAAAKDAEAEIGK